MANNPIMVPMTVASDSEAIEMSVGTDTEIFAMSVGVSIGGGGSGLTEDIKSALLACFEHVAWIDEDGQEYYDALYNALYPPADLVSISAVYTQSGVVYPTDSLDSLKPDLVVTAHYSDSSTATVTTYTLSGTLAAGTSTITVTYSGKTTTFNVTVTAAPVLDSITAVYTQSGTVYDTDSLDSLKTDLVVTAHYSDSSTSTVASSDYTLSGTLTVGTSTVTVSYSGKTTTFNVTVTQAQSGVLGYVDTGLIMLLDGIANSTGGTHESTITKLVDQTGNGYDWINKAGTVTASAKAIVFDGSSALQSDSSWENTQLAYAQAVEIVMDVTNPSTTQCVMAGLTIAHGLTQTGDGTICVKSNNLLNYTGAAYGCVPITTGVHTYSFVKVNSSSWKAYKDGVEVTNLSTGATWKSGWNCFGAFIGSGGGNIQYAFTGSVYSYRYYTSALSASDIASNYANDVTRFS